MAERRIEGTDEPGSDTSVPAMLLKSPPGKMKMRQMLPPLAMLLPREIERRQHVELGVC